MNFAMNAELDQSWSWDLYWLQILVGDTYDAPAQLAP